jgi:uncharacterized cupin superfamily protein
MESGITRTHADPTSTDRLQPLRRELGITTFGVSLMALEPGQRSRIHRHAVQEEAYLVLEGRLTVTVERENHELGPFDAIRVAPDLRRQLVNLGSERTLFLALGGSAEHAGRDGQAFASWDDTVPRLPGELPVPADIPTPRDVAVPPDLLSDR